MATWVGAFMRLKTWDMSRKVGDMWMYPKDADKTEQACVYVLDPILYRNTWCMFSFGGRPMAEAYERQVFVLQNFNKLTRAGAETGFKRVHFMKRVNEKYCAYRDALEKNSDIGLLAVPGHTGTTSSQDLPKAVSSVRNFNVFNVKDLQKGLGSTLSVQSIGTIIVVARPSENTITGADYPGKLSVHVDTATKLIKVYGGKLEASPKALGFEFDYETPSRLLHQVRQVFDQGYRVCDGDNAVYKEASRGLVDVNVDRVGMSTGPHTICTSSDNKCLVEQRVGWADSCFTNVLVLRSTTCTSVYNPRGSSTKRIRCPACARYIQNMSTKKRKRDDGITELSADTENPKNKCVVPYKYMRREQLVSRIKQLVGEKKAASRKINSYKDAIETARFEKAMFEPFQKPWIPSKRLFKCLCLRYWFDSSPFMKDLGHTPVDKLDLSRA
eukprot:CAMPEP_0203751286 /NCGR_PEP_ID=MMETSP0098-20131031/5386_1 /ASSEMBLY_ACC=CAM_ASM_000208 /TAXON_ID=96639 /ORGANISM=" , Strain NY0313808BC1" /LENGTH=441 /DNA_ID=CAMNT_0050640941 /DNA_START=218 /DNA_END=1544 /DNA_ORIENTATION=-